MNSKYKVKLINYIITLSIICTFGGCSTKDTTIVAGSSQQGKLSSGVGDYLFMDSGIIYAKEDENNTGRILYYFDTSLGTSVALCSKGNCSHTAVDTSSGKSKECDAQILAQMLLAVYNNRIYYIAQNDSNMNLVIKSRDMMGTDEKTEVELNAQYFGTDAWVYDNYIFLAAYTDVSYSFDAETKKSDSSKSILFVVNLENNEVEQVIQSEQIESTGVFVLSGYDGKKVNVYRTLDKKCFSYDMSKKSLSENPAQTEKLNGISIIDGNPNGNTYYVSTNEYMYGVNSVNGDIMQLNMLSGKEKVVYSPQPNGDNYGGCGITPAGDEGVLIDIREYNTGKILHFFYLDTENENLSEIESGFTSDFRNNGVDSAGSKGFIYNYPVDMKEGQQSYIGKFELRYMSITDFKDGNDQYIKVY